MVDRLHLCARSFTMYNVSSMFRIEHASLCETAADAIESGDQSHRIYRLAGASHPLMHELIVFERYRGFCLQMICRCRP